MNKLTDNNISTQIKEFRMRLGISLNKFAQMLELDPGAFSRVERGMCNPSYGTLMKIKRMIDGLPPDSRSKVQDLFSDFTIDSTE